MSPELPYLAAGGVAIIGGTVRDGAIPKDIGRVVIGVVGCVVIASASSGTRLAPLVHAFGLLVLLVTVMAATNATLNSRKGKLT